MAISPEEMKALKGRGNRLAIIMVIVLVVAVGGVAFSLYAKSTTDDRGAEAERVLGRKYENLDLDQFTNDYERLVVQDRLDEVHFPSAPHAAFVTSDGVSWTHLHSLYEIDGPARPICLTVDAVANPGHPNKVSFSTEGHRSSGGDSCR